MIEGQTGKWVVLTGVFLWLVLFAGGQSLLPCSAGAGSKGEALVLCLPGPVKTLDPTNYRDRETQVGLKMIFESLTTRNKDLDVVPLLAESIQALTPTTWEVRLKKNVFFHDGRTLTANDVRYTFDRVIREGAINGHTSVRKTLFGPLSEVRMMDEHTLRFITASPWPVLPLMMTLQEIVPEPSANASEKGHRVVGTGPFRFVEHDERGALVLERNENYHGAPATLAIRRLTIESEPDPVKRIAMLKRGKADIITQVPAGTLNLLTLNPEIRVLSCPATRSYFADLNCRKAPLNDRRFRIALNLAMDMGGIVRRVVEGRGQALSTVLLPQAFSWDSTLVPYPYAPEKAVALLKEDGLAIDRELTLYCTRANEGFAGAIAFYLNRMGLRFRIVTDERQAGIDAMKNLQADILVTSWGNSTLDPVGIIVPKFKSTGAGNYSGYDTPELDGLLDRAEATLDMDQRRDLYMEAQRIVFKDAPMIFGYAAEEFYAIRSHVKGFTPSMSGMMDLTSVFIDAGESP